MTTPDGWPNKGQLMSGLGESLEEMGPGSASTSSMGWSRALRQIDLDSLSKRSKAVMVLIGEEMSDGYNLTTLAKELGQPISWVSERLNELRNEILLRSGHTNFFPLNKDDFAALKESIREHGVRVPVLIGDHSLIDGKHRWTASLELGLKEIPAVFIHGLTEEQEHDIAVSVNSVRRHLDGKQKRALIRAELLRDWNKSDRRIAAICGVTHPTVGIVRREMREEENYRETDEDVHAAQAEVDRILSEEAAVKTEKRVDTLGRERDVIISPKPPVSRKFLGYACCIHGQMHEIYKVGDEYRLEVNLD